MKPLFELGQTVTTPGALEVLQNPDELLQKHLYLDPGELSEEDQEA